MPKTMQDKETKDWIRGQIEGIEAYDYSATTNGIMEAIGKIEQEAERKGKRDGLEDILSEVENWKTHYLDTTNSEPSRTMQVGLTNIIKDKLKLLEEENGKQNAR